MLLQEIEENKGWAAWKKEDMKLRELNDRLMMAERAFTDADGLFGMSWYKHLVSILMFHSFILYLYECPEEILSHYYLFCNFVDFSDLWSTQAQ